MKVFIVHAHPEKKSFNGALTERARTVLPAAGHEVQVSDLYAMGFDPVSDRRNFATTRDSQYLKQQDEELFASEQGGFATDIEAEIAKLEWCDALILQFPLWWFGLPAILKGWVDRVFVMGRIYGGGKWYDDGVFRGKRAMLSVSTGSPRGLYTPEGINGDIDQILFPINHGILHFVGFDALPAFVAFAPARVGDEGRKAYLDEFEKRLIELPNSAPIPFHSLRDYDENFQLKKV